MWPRHQFHSSKLRAEPRLGTGLGPGTGSRVDSSLQQLGAKKGNGSGKDQSGKKLSPGLFQNRRNSSNTAPLLPPRSSTYSPCPPPREPAPRVLTTRPCKDAHTQKNRIPLLSPLFRSSVIWFPGWKCPEPSLSSEAGEGVGLTPTPSSPTTHGVSATIGLDSLPLPPRGPTARAADRSQFP